MHARALIHILSLPIGVISAAMLIPLLIALLDGEMRVVSAFAYPVVFFSCLAALSAYIGRTQQFKMRGRDGFLLVTLTWVSAAVLGAIPFILSGVIPSWADAVFESASGFTTTGASVLADVEVLPRALLLWRSITHWLGGMGIVVLTVALLPLLGVGGFHLLKAETPGPDKEKLTPKVTSNAKIFWAIYLGMTVVLLGLLLLGGLDWFDALNYSFATAATGGVATKNLSVAHFNSAYIEGIITVFMVLSGAKFSLYFRLLQGKASDIWVNSELRAYLGIFIVASLGIAYFMLPTYDSFVTAYRYSSFQVASLLTTTGFMSTDYDLWPSFAKAILLIIMMIGGCSGSTGGGIKVVRLVVLFKQARNEMRRIMYPNGVFTIRLNGKIGRKDVIYGVLGFIGVYFALILIVMVIVASSGSDLMTSLSASLATVGNIGPGFAGVGPMQNYGGFPDYIMWVLSLAMIAGRLELWTVLILFTREFWRK